MGSTPAGRGDDGVAPADGPATDENAMTDGSGVAVVAALASLAGGAMAAVQARANSTLSVHLGQPVEASLWSFGSGWLLLFAGLVLLPRARRGLRRVAGAVRAGHLQWWEVLGGLFGAFFVAVQTQSVPRLGVALFTIALVGGQTANALAVDRIGLGPAGRQPLTPGRVAAALGTLVGVAIASTARSGSGAKGLAVTAIVLSVLAGAGMAVQQAVNGRVNQSSNDPVATTFVNFSWGLLALCGWALGLLATGHLHPPRNLHLPWWSLTGGVIGVCYIAIAAVAVRILGVLVQALMTLTGQLVTAVVLDLAAGTAHVGAQLLAGVAITLAAAVAAGMAARRANRRRPAVVAE